MLSEKEIFRDGIFISPLGKLKKIARIGTTNSAFVFSVELMKKEFAMKILIGNDKKHVKRFLAEYLNLTTVFLGDFIVKSFFYGEICNGNERYPYTLMPLCECNLKEYRKSLQIDLKEFERFKKFLFDAVEILHSNEIIHRDLKPENILLVKDAYKLADFGIAHFSQNAVVNGLTDKGERLANYQFSPREQFINHEGACVTMDIYAVGQLLLWFITGKTSIGAPTFDLPKEYPSYTKTLILKCIQDEPNERFQSIGDVRSFEKQMIEDAERIGQQKLARKKQYEKEERFRLNLEKFEELLLNINPELQTGQMVPVKKTMYFNKILNKYLNENAFDVRFVKYDAEDGNLSGPGDNLIKHVKRISKQLYINSHLFSVKKIVVYRDDSLSKSFIMFEANAYRPSFKEKIDNLLHKRKFEHGYAIVDGLYKISLNEAYNRIAGKLGDKRNEDLKNHSVEYYHYQMTSSYWVLGPDEGVVTLGKNLDEKTKDLVRCYLNKEGNISELEKIIFDCDWERSYIDEMLT